MKSLSEKRLIEIIDNAEIGRGGANIYGTCPKCGKNEFGMSTEAPHPYGCFRKKRCGFAGASIHSYLDFIGIDPKIFLGGESVDVFSNKLPKFGKHIGEGSLELPEEVKMPLLWERVYDDEYLRNRGFTDSDFKKHKVGYSKLRKGFVTILIEMDGKVRGFLSRSTKPKEWHLRHPKALRYDNSITTFSKLLGGYDELTGASTVILVEGFFDKISVDRYLDLDNDPDIKCCYTFGGHISDDQVNLLLNKGVRNVIVCFESDIINEIKRVLNKMGTKFDDVKVVSLPKKKDPNDLTEDEFLEVISNNTKDLVEYSLSHFQTRNI